MLIESGRKAGALTDDDARKWTERAYATFSARNRLFYDGVAEGSGWLLDKSGGLLKERGRCRDLGCWYAGVGDRIGLQIDQEEQEMNDG